MAKTKAVPAAAAGIGAGRVAKLIVGYRLKLKDPELLRKYMPEFQADARTVDPDKVKAQIEKKQQAWLESMGEMPYFAELDAVAIADPANERIGTWTSKDRGPKSGKPPVALAIAEWLLREYPNAWAADMFDDRPSGARFIGFDPKVFLKILGIECSLPENGKPLPVRLWYGHSDYRDIVESVTPKLGSSEVPLKVALDMRRPRNPDDALKWDEWMSTWTKPGVDPMLDVKIISELASQLGFLKE